MEIQPDFKELFELLNARQQKKLRRKKDLADIEALGED